MTNIYWLQSTGSNIVGSYAPQTGGATGNIITSNLNPAVYEYYYSGLPLWCSGVVQSLDTTEGSTDSNLLEQGKLIYSDSKLFVNGSVNFTGSEFMVKIQIGSPTGDQYSIIPLGAINKTMDGTPIFKTAYIRRLTTGSLLGEGGSVASMTNYPDITDVRSGTMYDYGIMTGTLDPRLPKTGQTATWNLGQIVNGSIIAGGSGYTQYDALNIIQSGTNGQFNVMTVDASGAVTSIQPSQYGTGYLPGSVFASGGTGSGCIINLIVVWPPCDDGFYQAGNTGSPRFTDNSDGTVTDNVTSLMWVQDPSLCGGSVYPNLWASGVAQPIAVKWEIGLINCEGLNYAGYADWRMPNVNELFSILDNDAESPSINTTFFPNTQTSPPYWTSSRLYNEGAAKYITFNHGDVANQDKTFSFLIRPVRDGI